MKKIKNKIKIIISHKIIRWILIPVLLFLFWVACSLVFNNKISFSMLLFKESKNAISSPTGKLLKDERVLGSFTAKENNLGIVTIKFNDYIKPDYANEDILVFKIKELGSKNWFYSGYYHSGTFEHLTYFPFGFTPVKDSLNKTYQFQLISLSGNNFNALEPAKSSGFQTGYQFSKSEIVHNRSFLLRFILEKIETSFTNIDFLLSSVTYFLPLLFYVFWLFYKRKKIFVKKYITVFTLILITIDIIFLNTLYIGVLIGLIVFWIFSIKLKRLENSISFKIAFIFVFISVLLIYIGASSYLAKANIWIYVFLIVGIFQVLMEEKLIK